MKHRQLNLASYFKLPNPGLRAYFHHTESGNSDDYRTPFWNKASRDSVLAKWQEIVDNLGMKQRYPGLYDYETEMKSKVGPLSVQKPLKDREEDIEHYYSSLKSTPISKEALDATVKFFEKARGLRLRGQERTLMRMKLSTNSGSWLFTKRRKVIRETLEYNLLTLEPLRPEAVNRRTGKRYELCATLGWRGQEGGIDDDNVKQRVIWMMPFLLNIKELQFYQPAVDAMQKHNLIPAYVSMDAVDREVTKLFDSKPKDDVVVCTDFSKFDQHFNRDMQNAACYVESKLGAPDWWLKQIFPVKFSIPLVCSPNLMYTGPHGMGSGSGGTNFDECMAHKALQFEAALSQGKELNPHSMAYGDDGILTFPGIKVEDVIQAYTRHGQEMNPTKQYVSKHEAIVLRRWHSTSYREGGIMVGVYSTFRALGRLLGQERYFDPDKWSPEMVELRAWSILENCNHHPYFEQFVDFVMTGDKYKLGIKLPGFLSGIEKHAIEAMENFGEDFLGFTRNIQLQGKSTNDIAKGIKEWRIFKYIKSKA